MFLSETILDVEIQFVPHSILIMSVLTDTFKRKIFHHFGVCLSLHGTRDLSQVELPPELKPGLVQLPLRVRPTAAQPDVDATAYQEAETLLLQVRLDSRLRQFIIININ